MSDAENSAHGGSREWAADGLSVVELYEQALKKRGFAADASQEAAVARLQRLFEEWTSYKERRRNALLRLLVKPPLPRGVYLWGGVGRGKTFLMDSFYRAVPLVRKRRVHFHHFMRDVHRELAELKSVPNPLDELAFRLAKRYRLICFDEFHVNDVADALILGRLFDRTVRGGVVYCMTSNYHPDELYRDGLKREDFMPAIRLIKESLDIINVDSGVDYRQRALAEVRAYHTPLGAATDGALMETFNRIAEVEEETHELDVEGRVIPYRHRAGGVVWFDFDVICGWGRSQHDYLDLARRFHTVIVAGVPRMGLSRADEARRFTLLVDVFYDNRVNLIVAAEAPPEHLLAVEGEAQDARLRAMQFEFDRTASRLMEMQSLAYLAEARRTSRETAGAMAAGAL
jgi:cell division protein ZapE